MSERVTPNEAQEGLELTPEAVMEALDKTGHDTVVQCMRVVAERITSDRTTYTDEDLMAMWDEMEDIRKAFAPAEDME